jgi:hypothetical protein
MGNKGQILINALLLFPVLLILAGVITRSGKSAFVYTQTQNLCDRIALDALAEQAKGIATLGKLNPYAKKVIDLRREIDLLLAAAVLQPELIPPLLQMRKTLQQAQKTIELTQKNIERLAIGLSQTQLLKLLPSKYRGKLSFKWTAEKFFHLRKETGYEMELGAPLDLSFDFQLKQRLSGIASIQTEKFLIPWKINPHQDFLKNPDMTLQCSAFIKMEGIENPWEVALTNTKVRPSWKQL